MEDVLNDPDWSFVNLHGINAIQFSDHNTILPRFTIPNLSMILHFYVLVCLFSLITLSQLLFYCSVTAIITEHTYFLWKEKTVGSSAHFKLAIQKFNLLANMTNIKSAIEGAAHFTTEDQKHAVVKIALENRLRQFSFL